MVVASRMAPATIAAPASAAKVKSEPSEAKKMSAKMFPVRSIGMRCRSVRTTLGIIGRAYPAKIHVLVCRSVKPRPAGPAAVRMIDSTARKTTVTVSPATNGGSQLRCSPMRTRA